MDEISHQAAVNDDLKSNANAHLLHVGLPQVDDERESKICNKVNYTA